MEADGGKVSYREFLESKRPMAQSDGFDPGELVYDPFGGLMTVPLEALRLGRRGRGVELNTGYFLDGVKYLQAEEERQHMPTLFDVEEIARPQAVGA